MNGLLKHIMKQIGFETIAETTGGIQVVRKKQSLWIFYDNCKPGFDIKICDKAQFNLAEPGSIEALEVAIGYCVSTKDCIQCQYGGEHDKLG